MFLQLSPMPWMYGTTMYGLLLLPLLLVVLVVPWLVFVFFFWWIFTLNRAQSGCLHLFRALLRWSSSPFSRCWLDQTAFGLCFKVLITLNLAKELSRILGPLVGSSPHHIKNTTDFVQQLTGITLQANEDIASYAVSALFISVLIDPAINIIRRKLELDQGLHLRTSMNVEQIISLLEFCLKTTYFQFQGRFFEQLQGIVMGSPISPIVANLYIEDFENKAINTAECSPRVWKRYVDDTFVAIEANKNQGFLDHINSVDPFIHFTTEDARTDGSIPFLDTIVMPQSDGSLWEVPLYWFLWPEWYH